MPNPSDGPGLIRLPAPGARVVVRYRLATGEATDALGQLLSADDQLVVVDGMRGIERIELRDVIAAKPVPPRPERRSGRVVRQDDSP